MTPSDKPDVDSDAPRRPDRIPRKSFVELMPTKNLIRAAVLLALLLAIVTFQRRSPQIGRMIAEGLFPPPPAQPAAPPAAARPPGPTVRMAAPPQPTPTPPAAPPKP